jgi:hypothetical protein
MIKKTIKMILGEKKINKLKFFIFRLRRIKRYHTILPPKAIFNYGCQVKILLLPKKHVFFGYYDITPFDERGAYLLSLAGKKSAIYGNDNMGVGYFCLETGEFIEVDRTETWNWQTGCRLQWYPEAHGKIFTYNKLIDGSYSSVFYDIERKKIIKKINYPIYSFFKKSSFAVSFNFSRLSRLRCGYGYSNLKDNTETISAPENDGVWLIDTERGQKKMIISLKRLSELNPIESMEDAEHYVNHLLPNHSSDGFVFLHRWVKKGIRYTRLVLSDLRGENIRIVADEGNVSHLAWKSRSEILATVGFISKKGKCYSGYYLYDREGNRKGIWEDIFNTDGHPSYSKEGVLVTDTRPDSFGERRVLLISRNGIVKELARVYNPKVHKDRCDPHPRWNLYGNNICFDSIHSGIRTVCILDVDKILDKKT